MKPSGAYFPKSSASSGLLQKAAAVLTTLVVFALALTFSVVVFAVVLTAGVAIWAYVWWKTRAVRKAMREQGEAFRAAQAAQSGREPGSGGLVLEGEVIREVRDEESSVRR